MMSREGEGPTKRGLREEDQRSPATSCISHWPPSWLLLVSCGGQRRLGFYITIKEEACREEMSSGGGNSQMGVLSALGLAVTSSAAIVICNKYLNSTLGFCFATTLMSWHLLVTFCMLHVAQRLRFFEAKSIDAQTILFGFLNGISIGLLNLSLGFNPVGFYQMTKLAIYTLHHLSEQEVQGGDTSEHHTPSEHSEKRHQEQTHLTIQLVIVYWVMFWIYGRRFREETPSKPPGEDAEP